MEQWKGFGKRLVESIHKAGFPNVAQFADAKGYRITYAYKWAAGTTPDPETLIRLTQDLDVSLDYLLRGEVSKAPVPPRKRGAKKLGCLVAALVFTLTGVSLDVPAKANPVIDHTTSYRKWRRLSQRLTNFVMGWGPRTPLSLGFQAHAGLA